MNWEIIMKKTSTSKTVPLANATSKELAAMGLKKKAFILPLHLAIDLELEAVNAQGSETEILIEALEKRLKK